MNLFISNAYAETAPPQGGGPLQLIIMIVIFSTIIYFLFIRPLRKRSKSKKSANTVQSEKILPESDKIHNSRKNTKQSLPKINFKIFLSYRRKDSADVTGRIYDRLVESFGENNIFKDVDSIPLGVDFREHIDSMIKNSSVLLIVIGNDWLGEFSNSEARRIDDPNDFVRLEVVTALRRKINIIPLLVRGGTIPKEEDLPEELKPLAYKNGISIRHDPDFNNDANRLINGINSLISSSHS